MRRATCVPQEAVSKGRLGLLLTTPGRRSRPGRGHRDSFLSSRFGFDSGCSLPVRTLALPDPVASSGMNDMQQIQVSRTVEAPVERVFALLADPDRHPDLDGSGMLRASRTHTVLTEVGDVFIMDLHAGDLGIYQSQSVVTSYVRDRALGWSPGPVDREPFGHTFTFTLDPDGDDHTLVTLTYDWSAVADEQLLAMMPRVSREDLTRSLDRLDAAL